MSKQLQNASLKLNKTQKEEGLLKKELDADKAKLSKLEYKVKDSQKSLDNEMNELKKEQA